jgi:ABC-type spermidine/putrescine transport system permease subunit I
MRSSYGWSTLGLPLFVFYIAAFIVPQAIFLTTSFYSPIGRANFGTEFTFANYVYVLTDEYYLTAFRKSVMVAAAVSIFGLILAFPLAYFIAQTRSRLGYLVLIVVVSMLFTNGVIRTLGWRILLSSAGPVNTTLINWGIISEPLWLLENYSGVIIGVMHALLPIYVVVLIPVCQSVSRNLLDASAGLGASRWQTFWGVIFPLTRTGILASMLLLFANSIGLFTTPAILGGGRVLLLPILIRERIMLALNWPIGATLAALLTLMTLVIVAGIAIATSKKRKRSVEKVAAGGA